MASLTGVKPSASYTSLLKLDGNTDSTVAGASGNAIQVKTGDNDATPLYLNTDRLGIGVADPDSTLEVLDTTTQLKLSYDSDSYASMTVGSDSYLTIACGDSGGVSLDDGILYVGKDSNTRGVLTLYDGDNSDKPGYIIFYTADGNAKYLHIDNTGDLRVSTGVPTNTSGTIVGTQS